nr:AbrB/MazE/SpoVT family DNA-binding domain-containing protein [Spirochaeta sp.]
MKTVVSERGQITLPKAIRTAMGIRAGTILDDPTFGTMSENALRDARRLAGLVICETVLAEIRPVFAS